MAFFSQNANLEAFFEMTQFNLLDFKAYYQKWNANNINSTHRINNSFMRVDER